MMRDIQQYIYIRILVSWLMFVERAEDHLNESLGVAFILYNPEITVENWVEDVSFSLERRNCQGDGLEVHLPVKTPPTRISLGVN